MTPSQDRQTSDKKAENPAKELYRELRSKAWEDLWEEDVAEFDCSPPQRRIRLAPVVRAVGVVAHESGDPAIRERAGEWLLRLLDDPSEKVRRYAIAALPKVGMDAKAEEALHRALERTICEREKARLAEGLGKIGSTSTLEKTARGELGLDETTVRKITANAARATEPGGFHLEAVLPGTCDCPVVFKCRKGLEALVAAEIAERLENVLHVESLVAGEVCTKPTAPFSLQALLRVRSASAFVFRLGSTEDPGSEEEEIELIARFLEGASVRDIIQTATDGTPRYRIEFGGSRRRALLKGIAIEAGKRVPWLFNDPRAALWELVLAEGSDGLGVDLAPRFRPDPRFIYRQEDIPAASYPPLAAALARTAGDWTGEGPERVWDPFCGSGLELIERGLPGGEIELFGSDHDKEALQAAERNIAAAGLVAQLAEADFRDAPARLGLAEGSLTLVLTNPPMGRRVPVENLGGLLRELMARVARLLAPGGRVVLVNPLPGPFKHPLLTLESSTKIDMGGFAAHMERYVKGVGIPGTGRVTRL